MSSATNFWDVQFSATDFKYGRQPNAFLRKQVCRLQPGSAILLPGDGEGRNSVWLAGLGHTVTALDSSSVGLSKARAFADETGVAIHTVLADLEAWEPIPASFDAVVITFVHLPSALRSVAHRKMACALRPGGWFILEVFHPKQLNYQSGGPKAEELLYTTEMLRSDLGDPAFAMEQLLAWEGVDTLDEGIGHQGPAFLTRYIAQKR